MFALISGPETSNKQVLFPGRRYEEERSVPGRIDRKSLLKEHQTLLLPDRGGAKMDFLGTPGSKYNLARNVSNFFYS